MKTTKLIFSIALLALGTISFGQRSFNIERLPSDQNHELAHFTSDGKIENSHIEFWMHDAQGWASEKVSFDVYETPVVDRTIYVEQVEVLYEENLRLESWMTTPFECSVAEEELNIESWMVIPFETDITEDELNIESWMTTPFETGEEIEMEPWMTTAWI